MSNCKTRSKHGRSLSIGPLDHDHMMQDIGHHHHQHHNHHHNQHHSSPHRSAMKDHHRLETNSGGGGGGGNLDCDTIDSITNKGQFYPLSSDMEDHHIHQIESKYGGHDRAQTSARIIQQAYRNFSLQRHFHNLRQSMLMQSAAAAPVKTDSFTKQQNDNYQYYQYHLHHLHHNHSHQQQQQQHSHQSSQTPSPNNITTTSTTTTTTAANANISTSGCCGGDSSSKTTPAGSVILHASGSASSFTSLLDRCPMMEDSHSFTSGGCYSRASSGHSLGGGVGATAISHHHLQQHNVDEDENCSTNDQQQIGVGVVGPLANSYYRIDAYNDTQEFPLGSSLPPAMELLCNKTSSQRNFHHSPNHSSRQFIHSSTIASDTLMIRPHDNENEQDNCITSSSGMIVNNNELDDTQLHTPATVTGMKTTFDFAQVACLEAGCRDSGLSYTSTSSAASSCAENINNTNGTLCNTTTPTDKITIHNLQQQNQKQSTTTTAPPVPPHRLDRKSHPNISLDHHHHQQQHHDLTCRMNTIQSSSSSCIVNNNNNVHASSLDSGVDDASPCDIIPSSSQPPAPPLQPPPPPPLVNQSISLQERSTINDLQQQQQHLLVPLSKPYCSNQMLMVMANGHRRRHTAPNVPNDSVSTDTITNHANVTIPSQGKFPSTTTTTTNGGGGSELIINNSHTYTHTHTPASSSSSISSNGNGGGGGVGMGVGGGNSINRKVPLPYSHQLQRVKLSDGADVFHLLPSSSALSSSASTSAATNQQRIATGTATTTTSASSITQPMLVNTTCQQQQQQQQYMMTTATSPPHCHCPCSLPILSPPLPPPPPTSSSCCSSSSSSMSMPFSSPVWKRKDDSMLINTNAVVCNIAGNCCASATCNANAPSYSSSPTFLHCHSNNSNNHSPPLPLPQQQQQQQQLHHFHHSHSVPHHYSHQHQLQQHYHHHPQQQLQQQPHSPYAAAATSSASSIQSCSSSSHSHSHIPTTNDDRRTTIASSSSPRTPTTTATTDSPSSSCLQQSQPLPLPLPLSSSISSKINRKRLYRIGLNQFNKKPWQGMEFLLKHKFLHNSPLEIANFLLTRKGLSRQMMGEFLGDKKSEHVLECYCSCIDFRRVPIDAALRCFNSSFLLAGESDRILRMTENFSQAYWRQNEKWLREEIRIKSVDATLLLSYSIMMLNTDLNSGKVKSSSRMKLKEFIKNLKGLNAGEDFDSKLLSGIYHRVQENPFHVGDDHSKQVAQIANALTPEGTLTAPPHRRLVCLCKMQECVLTEDASISRVHRSQSQQHAGGGGGGGGGSVSSHGYLHVHQQLRYVFLFNDVIVVACRLSSNAQQQLSSIPPALHTNSLNSSSSRTSASLSSRRSASSGGGGGGGGGGNGNASSGSGGGGGGVGSSDTTATTTGMSLQPLLACVGSASKSSSGGGNSGGNSGSKTNNTAANNQPNGGNQTDKYQVIHHTSLVGVRAHLLYRGETLYAVQLRQAANNHVLFTLRAMSVSDFVHFLDDLRECIQETNEMEALRITGEFGRPSAGAGACCASSNNNPSTSSSAIGGSCPGCTNADR